MIDVKHLSKSFGDHLVLDDISEHIAPGEKVVVIGPSGSGKSTCARLAARLWDVTEGTIRVGGVDISTVDPEALLTDYSMVFQDVVLFDDTVMENIRLGKRGATDEEVRAAAEAANCGEFIRRLPQGYDTPIGENGAKLSGGERQRISIARALLKNAPIVLLDEATASLDVENETKVQGALSRLLAGKTVLVIAHRMRHTFDHSRQNIFHSHAGLARCTNDIFTFATQQVDYFIFHLLGHCTCHITLVHHGNNFEVVLQCHIKVGNSLRLHSL